VTCLGKDSYIAHRPPAGKRRHDVIMNASLKKRESTGDGDKDREDLFTQGHGALMKEGDAKRIQAHQYRCAMGTLREESALVGRGRW